ncbi:MAG: response regulator [Proteobacteria bacterium]|nr:MAG: response regulator [Pseudomonadota bacterium]
MAKILIVDDSESIRVELKDILESAGFTVFAGVDGNNGFQIAESQDYFDFILSDYNMPGLDGLSMIQKIKTLPKYETTPFGMLTTESSKELKDAGKQAGIVVWVVKPFEKDRLIATIAKVFEKFKPRA